MSPTDCPISVRIVGTVASTTPTANSAKPTAKAGRSIASRQSRGCRGAGRACPGFAFGTLGAAGWPRSTCQRRIRAASKPELAALIADPLQGVRAGFHLIRGVVQGAAHELGELVPLPAVGAVTGPHHYSRSNAERRAVMPRAV